MSQEARPGERSRLGRIFERYAPTARILGQRPPQEVELPAQPILIAAQETPTFLEVNPSPDLLEPLLGPLPAIIVDRENRLLNISGRPVRLGGDIEWKIFTSILDSGIAGITNREIDRAASSVDSLNTSSNLIANLRKKLEVDPKEPRIVISLGGRGTRRHYLRGRISYGDVASQNVAALQLASIPEGDFIIGPHTLTEEEIGTFARVLRMTWTAHRSGVNRWGITLDQDRTAKIYEVMKKYKSPDVVTEESLIAIRNKLRRFSIEKEQILAENPEDILVLLEPFERLLDVASLSKAFTDLFNGYKSIYRVKGSEEVNPGRIDLAEEEAL